jgi:hypothetical protein
MNNTYDAKREKFNFACFKTFGYDVKVRLIQEILYQNYMRSELFLLYCTNEKFRPFIDMKNLNLKITKDNDIYFENNSDFNDRNCIINMQKPILLKFVNMLKNKEITINKLYVEGISHFTSQLPNYARWTRFNNVCLYNYRSYESSNSEFEFHFVVTEELVDEDELYYILERIKLDYVNNNSYKIYLNFEISPLIDIALFYEVYDFADRLFNESFHEKVEFKINYEIKYVFSFDDYIKHNNSNKSNFSQFKSFWEQFNRYYHVNTNLDTFLLFGFEFGCEYSTLAPDYNMDNFAFSIIENLNSSLAIPLLKTVKKVGIIGLSETIPLLEFYGSMFRLLNSLEVLSIDTYILFFSDLFKIPRKFPKLRKIEISDYYILDRHHELLEQVKIPKSVHKICLKLDKESYKIFRIIKGKNIKILKIELNNYEYDFKYLDMLELSGLETIEFVIHEKSTKQIKMLNFNGVGKSLKEIKIDSSITTWDCLLMFPDLDAKYLLGLYTNTSILGSNLKYVHKKEKKELCEINYETSQIFR